VRKTSGCFLNILVVPVPRPLRDFSVYCATKAGLASLTRSLALELGPEVRVNGIAPGAILWPEGEASYEEVNRQKILANTPLKRMGEPTDIARTVQFLACDAPFITGDIITVDGGWSLAN
jgi:pteridine reductase